MAQFITNAEIGEIFPEEVASQTAPKDVEVYGIKDGNVYVRRFHNTEGYPVPALDAYIVAVFHNGERETLRTSDPAEITLWTEHLRG